MTAEMSKTRGGGGKESGKSVKCNSNYLKVRGDEIKKLSHRKLFHFLLITTRI